MGKRYEYQLELANAGKRTTLDESLFIGFSSGGRNFLLRQEKVFAVAALPHSSTPVPGASSFIDGMVHAMGDLWVALDFNNFLDGRDKVAKTQSARIIMVGTPLDGVAIITDRVSRVESEVSFEEATEDVASDKWVSRLFSHVRDATRYEEIDVEKLVSAVRQMAVTATKLEGV